MEEIKNQLDKLEDDFGDLNNLIQTMSNALDNVVDDCSDAYHLTALQKIITQKSDDITDEIDEISYKIYQKIIPQITT